MSILWILCALCGSHIRGFWWPRYAQIVAFYGSNCTIRKAAIHCQSGWFDRCIICPAGRWIWLGMELKGRQGILCSQMDASWNIMNHIESWCCCCIAVLPCTSEFQLGEHRLHGTCRLRPWSWRLIRNCLLAYGICMAYMGMERAAQGCAKLWDEHRWTMMNHSQHSNILPAVLCDEWTCVSLFTSLILLKWLSLTSTCSAGFISTLKRASGSRSEAAHCDMCSHESRTPKLFSFHQPFLSSPRKNLARVTDSVGLLHTIWFESIGSLRLEPCSYIHVYTSFS